jgi:very-short-patch-repair endonuclease
MQIVDNFVKGLGNTQTLAPFVDSQILLAAARFIGESMFERFFYEVDEYWPDSPIEQAMFLSLACVSFSDQDTRTVFSTCRNSLCSDERESTYLRGNELRRMVICPQHSILSYRADFAMFGSGYDTSTGLWVKAQPVAIECDGHDFHEKTKQQAMRDKKRDRAIQISGLKILRYTGAEIHADPIGCAKEAFSASATKL